ncbi:hypothetical protein H0H92_000315 [Tricholoma furcatifolium]|nr:hypothetical protein H0H92_000315 [Tricholoma furcatifolium]
MNPIKFPTFDLGAALERAYVENEYCVDDTPQGSLATSASEHCEKRRSASPELTGTAVDHAQPETNSQPSKKSKNARGTKPITTEITYTDFLVQKYGYTGLHAQPDEEGNFFATLDDTIAAGYHLVKWDGM